MATIETTPKSPINQRDELVTCVAKAKSFIRPIISSNTHVKKK